MDEDIRIKDLPLVEDGIQSTDYIAVDNEDDGTRKATMQDIAEANINGLETEATNTKGAINELFNKASRTVSLTQAEYDALPASKLSDDIAYFITDGEPDVDNTLWAKVGRATLDTQAQNCSEAINEIKQSLSNLLTIKSITVSHGTINAGQASTITDARLKNENIIICSISVGGSYNSDCIPWSYYGSANGFVSRLKNTGSNQATNIVVTYRYIELP